ncbi:MAG TPA: ABC transporter permease [Bryobacteraceae bacterium]|jgi:predicted permease
MFRRRRNQSDFKAEIKAHLAAETDHLREQGLTKEQAEAAARAFGDATLATERFYDRGRWIWLDGLLSDVRYAIRTLAKSRGFTATALIALTLGIGANTAVFTVLKTVLLDSLPYPEADRIVNIGRPGNDSTTNIPRFGFLEQNNPGFEDLTAYHAVANMNLSGGDRPEPANVITASRNYFDLFGAKPVLGRTFTAGEDAPGGPDVAVLSFGLWQRQFGGQPSIIGKTIALGGAPYRVVGILSSSFTPNPAGDVWTPLQADENSTNLAIFLRIAARLPRHVTLAQANSWMAVIGRRYLETHPQQLDIAQQVQVAFMQRQLTGNVRPALLILLGAVGLVLLIAYANVANILMARATGRQREIAIRAAIGAGRRRIVRQLLTESLMLALAGGALGLAFGSWGIRALLALTPGDLPRLQEMAAIPAIDPQIAAFSCLLSAVAGVLFGLIPAFQLSRAEFNISLNESGSRTGSSLRQNRARGVLVAAEVAIAVVLLCGAVLLIRSFAAMHSVSLGFDPKNLLTVEISLAGSGYSKSSEVDRLTRKLVERMESISGVESAAVASALPLWGKVDMLFSIPGRTPPGRQVNGDVQWRYVSPQYFHVLRIPLISGRFLRDGESGRAVLISQAMARKFWPGENPVGQQIFIGAGLDPAYQGGLTQIVGVVGDVRERLFSDPSPVMYQAPSQIPDADIALLNGLEHSAILLRTQAGVAPMSVDHAVRQALVTGEGLAAVNVRTMDQASLDSTARQNFNVLLLTIFAAIALLLAMVGIYGVISYSVEQRTHEIGIRAALGANRRDTVRLVLGQALRVAAVGIVCGTAASAALTRLLSAQLFAVKPLDPLTFVSVPAILLATAIAAAYVPALRAARVDPAIALRHE